MRTPIHHTKLPKAAYELMSEDQKSYIDEFSFFQLPSGEIVADYAGQCLALWNGSGWEVYSSKTRASVKLAEEWMRKTLTECEEGDVSAFDLAVDWDLCEMCEINGDKTFIPTWLTDMAATFIPDDLEEGK